MNLLERKPLLHLLLWKCGLASALTQTSAAEQACLERLATDQKVVVEIGVWHGVNTLSMRSRMAVDGTLYAIDPFVPGRFGICCQKHVAHGEGSKSRRGRLVWLEHFSHDALAVFQAQCPEPIDFLFIDGDHSFEGVKLDWELWSSLIRPGGKIALHDSRSYPGRQIDSMGSARFTRETVVHDSRYKVVETVDSLTVLERLP